MSDLDALWVPSLMPDNSGYYLTTPSYRIIYSCVGLVEDRQDFD
jgi:hypothetical protein